MSELLSETRYIKVSYMKDNKKMKNIINHPEYINTCDFFIGWYLSSGLQRSNYIYSVWYYGSAPWILTGNIAHWENT